MSTLNISKRQVDGATIVDLDGKIQIGETNRQLHEAIYELIAEGRNRVVLNLEKVTAIDSSGLGEIVAGFSTLVKAGGTLKLVNMPDRVTDIMTVTKLYTVFDVYDSEAEAVASFDTDDATEHAAA